jgi:5-methyltetrahydrofolate--homocysteine methyltransferase
LERLGGRAVVNSVNYEDGDGPDSRFARIMPLVREHGAAVVALTIDETGQARTADHKLAVATRLIEDLTSNWNMRVSDILVDTLTFPIATGQEETRRDAIETIAAIRALKVAYPEVQTVLGVSNVSFGLNPAARQVLNSVFLDEAMKAGLDAAIIHPSKILPIARIDEDYYKVALDLVHDRREYDAAGNTTYDPLGRFLDLFADIQAQSGGRSREEELAELPLVERIGRRIVEAERQGLVVDLDEALTSMAALSIVNDVLLPAMREVGELFATGQMQLPFVLASAETMKAAVAHLEPHMESSGESGKGSIVLATVKGDVHDIGKNLVDIILTNNGYTVVNIGIKQPMQAILDAAEANQVDVIGMSGLLVKSTLVMRDNLDELNKRGVAKKYPVLLGGAALTRAFVEEDLAGMYDGEVRYAKDAFEGLALMDAVMNVKRGVPGATLPALRGRRVALKEKVVDHNVVIDTVTRSNIALDNAIPKAPFWGERIVKGIPLNDYLPYLDERALFLGQWGLKASRGDGPGYEELVETEGRPRLRALLDSAQRDGLLEAAVVYGYFPAVAEGNDVVILDHEGPNAGGERYRFKFPRQTRDRRLCLADFVRPRESGEVDVVGFHVVTMGSRMSEAAAKLFEANAYRDYLELHGLGVQLTEALAEAWHARIRKELGLAGADSPEMKRILKQDYQGERYSFGYPACPDLTAQTELAALLRPERIGVTVSEEFQLHPEQSTSAIIFHHPEATYFNAT